MRMHFPKHLQNILASFSHRFC